MRVSTLSKTSLGLIYIKSTHGLVLREVTDSLVEAYPESRVQNPEAVRLISRDNMEVGSISLYVVSSIDSTIQAYGILASIGRKHPQSANGLQNACQDNG